MVGSRKAYSKTISAFCESSDIATHESGTKQESIKKAGYRSEFLRPAFLCLPVENLKGVDLSQDQGDPLHRYHYFRTHCLFLHQSYQKRYYR